MSLKGVLKRIAVSLITVFLAMLLTFFLLRMTPGSAIDTWARDYATQRGMSLDEAYRQITAMINYNPKEPLFAQLGRYLGGLMHGNLGMSMIYQNVSVNEIIANALPWTLFVLSVSLIISFLIGINLGAMMAFKRKTILDPIISIYAILTSSVPNFIVGILLLVIFSFQFGWFPVNGAYDPIVDPGFNFPFLLNVLYHGALPILTYVITTIGTWALTMKGSAVNVLGEDYIIAASIRGVSERTLMNRYVKRNAMLPLITTLAVSFGFMLGGSPLIENVFSYPGMGYYIGQATQQRDYTLMQGLLLVTSLAVILANLASDLIYAKLDPRVKLEEG
ncbi:ABC transporter permease [Paenibacillus lupini]|uniref:ABC transporter permease n=1 Tax=Paenibacillus lupini TaxID=1450204 RepID=UPI0014224434|nr:ABC transporter permease [Paenibacillus lupini]NIK21939.1 peptide/nickel transport system permease protein [Paenibacillus lupini]